MSEIIERAAKALKEESERLFEERRPPEIRDFFAGKEGSGWESLVRAVLSAIREPSQEMFLIAEQAGVSFATQQRVWPIMIDAALSEAKSADRTKPDFKTDLKTASEPSEKPL